MPDRKKGYENRPKKRRRNFSRERKMPFKKLIRFMPGMVKESSQKTPERFFPKIKEAARMNRAGRRSVWRGKK